MIWLSNKLGVQRAHLAASFIAIQSIPCDLWEKGPEILSFPFVIPKIQKNKF